MYYIGDGYSDAVAMRLVYNNGGKADFVHQQNQDEELYHCTVRIYETLNSDGMIDFCCLQKKLGQICPNALFFKKNLCS